MQKINSFIVVIFLTLSITSCLSKPSSVNCSTYKNGEFRYKFSLDGKFIFFSIKRNDSLQYEKNLTTGESAVYKITWVDSCTYELQYLKGNTHSSQEELEMRKKAIITTKIIGGSEKFYLFKTSSSLNKIGLTDTIWVYH